MEEETSFIIYEGVVVPESMLRRRERDRYRTLLDAKDEERMAWHEWLV